MELSGSRQATQRAHPGGYLGSFSSGLHCSEASSAKKQHADEVNVSLAPTSVPRAQWTFVYQQHGVTYIILGDLDTHIGICVDASRACHFGHHRHKQTLRMRADPKSSLYPLET